MYIGAWQEFKLAKILWIKEKVDRESTEANQIQPGKPNSQKAYS